jgi:hypothetical protein
MNPVVEARKEYLLERVTRCSGRAFQDYFIRFGPSYPGLLGIELAFYHSQAKQRLIH